MEKNKLPETWEQAKIDELTKSRKIGLVRSRREQFEHGVPYLKMNNITINGNLDLSSLKYVQCTPEEKTSFMLESGDILFNTRNSYELVGKTAFWNDAVQNCVYNNNIMRLKVHDVLLPKFLVYFMNSNQFKNSLLSIKKSTTNICAIYDKDLKNQVVPIPPLDQQKRIVKKIEECFSTIESLSNNLSKISFQIIQVKSSYLNSVFDKTSRKWDEKIIDDVVKIIDYRGRTPPYSQTGIPHLRSNNIKNGTINHNKLKFVSKKTYDEFMTRGIPQKGDLLFTTEAPLGEIAHIPNEKFSLAQRLIILRPLDHDSNFLMYQIMSPDFHLRLTGKKSGTTVTGVSSRNFKPMKILTTTKNEEQKISKQIETYLSKLEYLQIIVKQNLKTLSSLKILILKQAFEGKLVPQDPNDEPASELLKRIKN